MVHGIPDPLLMLEVQVIETRKAAVAVAREIFDAAVRSGCDCSILLAQADRIAKGDDMTRARIARLLRAELTAGSSSTQTRTKNKML